MTNVCGIQQKPTPVDSLNKGSECSILLINYKSLLSSPKRLKTFPVVETFTWSSADERTRKKEITKVKRRDIILTMTYTTMLEAKKGTNEFGKVRLILINMLLKAYNNYKRVIKTEASIYILYIRYFLIYRLYIDSIVLVNTKPITD